MYAIEYPKLPMELDTLAPDSNQPPEYWAEVEAAQKLLPDFGMLWDSWAVWNAGKIPEADIFLHVPRFLGDFTGDKAAIAALFDADFALGADLDARFEQLLGGGELVGLEYELGDIEGRFERDLRRAKLANKIDALFCEAHVRNRWDLLDKAYPAVWNALATYRHFEVTFDGWKKKSLQIPKPSPRPLPWSGFPDKLLEARAEVAARIESGEALEELERLAEERAEWGLPTPNWLGPYVEYWPRWWLVEGGEYGIEGEPNTGSKATSPKTSRELGDGKFGQGTNFSPAWKRWRVVQPILVPEPPEWNDYAVKVGLSIFAGIAVGAFASSWSQAIWQGMGAPLGDVGLAAAEGALQGAGSSALSGDNVLDGALSGIGSAALTGALDYAEAADLAGELGDIGGELASGALVGALEATLTGSSIGSAALAGAAGAAKDSAGELVAAAGGSENLSTVADLATGNLDPEDIMNLDLSSLDGALDGVGDFLDTIGGLKNQVGDLFGSPGTGAPPLAPSGWPGPGPVYEPDEAGGGAVATPEQLASWEWWGDNSTLVFAGLVAALLLVK